MIFQRNITIFHKVNLKTSKLVSEIKLFCRKYAKRRKYMVGTVCTYNGYLHDDSGEKRKKLFLQDDFLFWAIFNENLTFMSSANDFYRVKRGLNPAERMKRSNLS